VRKQSKEHALRTILLSASGRSDECSKLWVAVVAQTLVDATIDFNKQFLGQSDAGKSRRREAEMDKKSARLHIANAGFAKDCEMAGLDPEYVLERFYRMEAAA